MIDFWLGEVTQLIIHGQFVSNIGRNRSRILGIDFTNKNEKNPLPVSAGYL